MTDDTEGKREQRLDPGNVTSALDQTMHEARDRALEF
jgi:hypothetical protein